MHRVNEIMSQGVVRIAPTESIGMLSLADIATRSAGPARDDVANTLEGVSQPRRT
ncbi:CBS domain-containing protein [Burkholderia lata]|nr:CBS domain-containing protein [Burkholderia lata]